MARDGVLPASFATVHPRYHTPALAIVVYAAIVAALAISSSFETLVVMANVTALALYLLCVGASYQLQRRDVQMAGTPFRLPGGLAVPLLAGAGIIWLLAQATAREYRVAGGAIAVATAYYVIKQRFAGPASGASASRAQGR